jgi:hypothetical protein
MAEAIASENARLFALRQGRPLPEAPSALGLIRKPPHVGAREAAQEVFQPAGALQRPVEELSARPELLKPQPVSIDNAAPGKGTANPRFRAR